MINWNNSTTDELLDAILAAENRDEARRLLRDLLTPQEIVEFGKRWQVAKLLEAGIPYSRIEKQTGMSSTTIARVSKYLNGKYGGYKLTLRRLKTSEVEYFKNTNRNSTSEVNGVPKYTFGTQNVAHHTHSQPMLESG